MPTLRLLYVTAEAHPTFRADVRVLFGKYLPRHGVLCDLFTHPAPPGATEPWPAGRVDLSAPPRNRWHKQWTQLRHDLCLFHKARQGYSAVQVRDRILAGVIGWLAARRAGIPFFYWCSYPKAESRVLVARQIGFAQAPLRWMVNMLRGHLSVWIMYAWLLPHADHVFVQSDAMLQAFTSKGIDPRRMTAVPMGVDAEAAAVSEPLDAPVAAQLTGRRVIAYVGALDGVRQPELMVHAMALLRQEWPDALLVLAGSSPEPRDMARLHNLTTELGVDDHVLFTGWLPAAQALALIRSAEIGLSMVPRGNLYDISSPTKLAEYFVHGLPVVASDLPDQEQVMRESGAGHCIPFDPCALAHTLDSMLKHPAEARQQGGRGRTFILARRSYATISREVACTYRTLLVSCSVGAQLPAHEREA